MSPRRLLILGTAVAASFGCRSGSTATDPPMVPPIELRDGAGALAARVLPGHPCRATIGNQELIVGGHPLVADIGATHYAGEDAANGTTIKRDGTPVARLYADQLFDPDGIPILRALQNGDIVDPTSRVIRRATAQPDGIHVDGVTDTAFHAIVTNTKSIPVAAFLSMKEASPDLRALTVCNYLLEP